MNKVLDLLDLYVSKKDRKSALSYYSEAPSFYKTVGCIDVLIDGGAGAKRVRCGFFVNPVTLQYFCGSKAYGFFEDVTSTMDTKYKNKISTPGPDHVPTKIDPNCYLVVDEFEDVTETLNMKCDFSVHTLKTSPQKLVVFKPDDSFIARHK